VFNVVFVPWPWFRILEMKKWTDGLFVKCFAGKLGNDFIKEDEDVAEARLAFLEKNERYTKDTMSVCFFCQFVMSGYVSFCLSVCLCVCLSVSFCLPACRSVRLLT